MAICFGAFKQGTVCSAGCSCRARQWWTLARHRGLSRLLRLVLLRLELVLLRMGLKLLLLLQWLVWLVLWRWRRLLRWRLRRCALAHTFMFAESFAPWGAW